MRRIFWLAAAVASLSLTACERDRTRVEAVPPVAPGQLAVVEGVLSDVERDAIDINTQRFGEMEFELHEGVGIYQNGVIMDRDALVEGAQVRATYRMMGDEKSLVRLEVTPLAVE